MVREVLAGLNGRWVDLALQGLAIWPNMEMGVKA